MSITDELRKWGYGFCGDTHDVVTAIADRIDAEHEKAMNRAGQLLADAESDRNCYYVNWQDCKRKVLQGNITFDELNARIESLEDELSHCIELPKDADGEYIHIGDMMEYGKAHGRVIALMLSNYPKKWGGGLHWGIQLEGEHAPTALDSLFRHYHAPTVEDVLREFAEKMNENIGMYTSEAIDADEWRDADARTVEKYAAKMREVMAK